MNKLKMEIELDIPDEASWLAQDKDGAWYAYEYEPYRELNLWKSDDQYWHVGSSASPTNWEDELYELVWEWY